MVCFILTIIVTALTGCSKDDDPDPGDNGSFSGWVEVNGKKYNFSYAYGMWFNNDQDVEFQAFNKDIYSLNPADRVNYMTIGISFNEDGTFDFRGGQNLDIEVGLDVNLGSEDTSHEWYASYIINNNPGTVTASKNGRSFVIDGKDVVVRYPRDGEEGINSSSPTTTINFHAEGSIQIMDYNEDDY